MDPKSLAKSKRSHSQHHSKKPHHPNQKPKAPSSGTVEAGSAKKPSGKQVREKPILSKGSSSLPSNWDRYDEELDSGFEDPSCGGNSSAAADVVFPKSKGADYRHLISEAQSQFQSNAYSNPFASLEDVLPDFNQGVHSMLSIRGQSILSWIEDDNFIVDDRATSSHEAPFLSLNLHTLADQLAKVDLSQRLFIEADLLPSELQTEAFEASSSRASEPMPSTHASEAAARISDDSAINDSSKKDQIADQNSEIMPFGNLSSSSPVPTLSTQWSKSVNQTKDDSRQFSDSDQSRGLESTEQPKNSYLADPKKNPPVFEPSAAEAELDLLLNSFGETSFLDSSSSKEKPSNTLPVSQETPAPPPQIAREGPNLYGTASATANLDNAIDDLLEETCNLMNQKDALLSLDASAPLDGGALSHSNPKSKVLDDFDSWLDTIG